AQDVEPALELGLALGLLAAGDEHLQVHGLGRLHRLAERRVVGRHLAPAQQRHALALDHLRIDVADHLPPVGIAWHEQRADRVLAGLGQRESKPRRLPGEELVRDLHQDAGAVARARIGADRAAMLEIAEDGEGVLDQLVRLAALDVGDEADPAGILFERGIVEALWRQALRARRSVVRMRGNTSVAARVTRGAASDLLRALVCRAHPRPRVSPRRERPRSSPSRHAFPSLTPTDATVSKAPLVIGGLLAAASRRKRVAARVRRPGDAMAPLITVRYWAG